MFRRLVVSIDRARALLKAQQLGLFGQRAPMTLHGQTSGSGPTRAVVKAPAPGTHVEERRVAAHVRHTKDGETVMVAPHVKHVHVAEEPPPPAPAPPPPAPEPAPAPPPAPVAPKAFGTGAIDDSVPKPVPMPAPDVVGQHERIVSEPIVDKPKRAPATSFGPDGTMYAGEVPPDGWTSEDDDARDLDEYTYLKITSTEKGGSYPAFIPPGATKVENVPGIPGAQLVTYPGPLHMEDAAALGMRPAHSIQPDGNIRYRMSPSHAEQGHGPRAASRTYFAVLDDNLDQFHEKLDKLKKKAKRYKALGTPEAEEIGKGVRRMAVGIRRDFDGKPTGYFYANLPVTVMRVTGPKVQVPGGWQLRAKIEPLAEGINQVHAVGSTNGVKLPEQLWRSGMYCDHCKTNRDRGLIYAFQDPKGEWKRCGSSCLQDFVGVTPAAIAFAAEDFGELADPDANDDADYMGEGGGGRRGGYVPLEQVLALASAAMDEDGGYVSAKEAERHMIMSTGNRVSRELGRPGRLSRLIHQEPHHRELAQQVQAWGQTLDPKDDYERNLRAYAHAGAVNLRKRGPGMAASMVNAFTRHHEQQAFERRPKAGWFGKVGEKFGPNTQPGKKGGAAKHQQPPRLVKITGKFATESDFGPTTAISMIDDHGHRFKWWASGDAGSGFEPGQIVEIAGGEIKKHASYTPRSRGGDRGTYPTLQPGGAAAPTVINETQLTRAKLEPVETAAQKEWTARKTEQLLHDNGEHRAAFDKLNAKMLGEDGLEKHEQQVIQAWIDDHPEENEKHGIAGVRYRLQAEAARRWLHSLSPEEQSYLPDAEGDWRDDGTRAQDVTARLSRPEYHKPEVLTPEKAKEHATHLWNLRAKRKVAEPIGALTRAELEAQQGAKPMNKAVVRTGGGGRGGGGGGPKPPTSPAPGAPARGSIPPTPGQHVKFRHPATGEEAEGHIHGNGGVKGVTVVDGEGTPHQVPHGHYMHVRPQDQAPEGQPKPDAEQVALAARKHLDLGPEAPLAVHGAAALLVVGGVKNVHEMQTRQVKFQGGAALIDPDKLRTKEPALVKVLQALAQASPKGALFTVRGKPITEQSLTAYVRRFGVPHGQGGAITPPGATPPGAAPGTPLGAQPMAKAAAAAHLLPADEPASDQWEHLGFVCKFRKGAHGIGLLTIEGPGMPMPLHEVVGNAHIARTCAAEQIPLLQQGKAPSRGVYQAVR